LGSLARAVRQRASKRGSRSGRCRDGGSGAWVRVCVKPIKCLNGA
jgi:hypothetical protein